MQLERWICTRLAKTIKTFKKELVIRNVNDLNMLGICSCLACSNMSLTHVQNCSRTCCLCSSCINLVYDMRTTGI